MQATIPVSQSALVFAEAVHANGLLLLATPMPDDVFDVWGGEELSWSRLERRFPGSPPIWWRNRSENRPIADALRWLVQKGFVLEGAVSGGRLTISTQEGGVVMRCLSTGSDSYYRNIVVHYQYRTIAMP